MDRKGRQRKRERLTAPAGTGWHEERKAVTTRDMVSLLSLGVTAAVFAALSLSPLARRRSWAAVVPPLASIIGSGFLVSAPLLGRHFGSYAIFAMGLLLAAAWGFGAAVRHNILRVEGRADLAPHVAGLDRLSELALIFAYLVSVGYYLMLLGSFLTRFALGETDRELGRWIATVLVILISWLGWSGGLGRVIRVEGHVVAFKLAVIAGFLVALGWHVARLVGREGPGALAPLPGEAGLHGVPILLGLLIVVQGFETSRYMGEEFPAGLRVRTMRIAQIVAAGIYLLFFALVTPLLPATLEGAGETAIINVAAVLGALLPMLLTLGAMASQFSAAVADAIGGAGLAVEFTRRRLGVRQTFPVFGVAVIGILWATDVFGIIALASRAFALYYMLQCLVAAAEVHAREGFSGRCCRFAALAGLAAAVVMFGVPADNR